MKVRVKPKGKNPIEFEWPVAGDGELSSIGVAQRAIEMHDPRGEGRVTAGRFTHHYDGGKLKYGGKRK